MESLEAQISAVSSKLQQLLRKNSLLQKEVERLTTEVNALREKEKNYEATIFSLSEKVNILQVGSGQDEAGKKEFEKRIDAYLKEIDKCIGMLSE